MAGVYEDEYWVPEHVRGYLRGLGFALPLEAMEPHIRAWDRWMRSTRCRCICAGMPSARALAVLAVVRVRSLRHLLLLLPLLETMERVRTLRPLLHLLPHPNALLAKRGRIGS